MNNTNSYPPPTPMQVPDCPLGPTFSAFLSGSEVPHRLDIWESFFPGNCGRRSGLSADSRLRLIGLSGGRSLGMGGGDEGFPCYGLGGRRFSSHSVWNTPGLSTRWYVWAPK